MEHVQGHQGSILDLQGGRDCWHHHQMLDGWSSNLTSVQEFRLGGAGCPCPSYVASASCAGETIGELFPLCK